MSKYLVVGVRRQRQASAPGAQDQKQQAQIETQETPSEHQETCFYCEGDRALHWLPREAVESPLLEILKSHMDAVLGNVCE